MANVNPNLNNNEAKTERHDRYKVEVMAQDTSVRTLGIPAHKPRVRVMEITRRELKSVPTATHAVVRGLDGKEHVVYAADGWWSCQLKALKL